MRRSSSWAAGVIAAVFLAAPAAPAVAVDEPAPSAEAAPRLVPTEPELTPNGPRIVLPWMGTQLNLREGWALQTLEPAPDLGTAPAGSAWETLRIDSPDGLHTCSLFAAIAPDEAPSFYGGNVRARRRDVDEPQWVLDGERATLLYPDPVSRLEDPEAWGDDDWASQPSVCSPGPARDVVYAWACAQSRAATGQPYSPFAITPVLPSEPAAAAAWSQARPAGQMQEPRRGFSATLLPDGRVLVIGGIVGHGQRLGTAEVWDPASGRFGPAGELVRSRGRHAAVLQPDGRVLVIGGTGREGRRAVDAEMWDPASDSFARQAGLRHPRSSGATILGFDDGSALVVGGKRADGSGPALQAERWDPSTGSFEPAGRLPGPRNVALVQALRGGALVTDDSPRDWLAWDADDRRFRAVPRTLEQRDENYVLGEGKVLSVGVTDSCSRGLRARAAGVIDAELWRPGRAAWRAAGRYRQPRYDPAVTTLPDGRALFYGGGDASVCTSASRRSTAEVWDPRTRTFGRAGRSEVPRWDHADVLLSDGRVAMIGGMGYADQTCGEALVGAIEVWDPERARFTVAGALTIARTEPTTVLLPDGRVLVLGGFDRLGDPVATAELWTPPPTQ